MIKKLKAFTLIELLVVVAIIGILATIVVINFSGATIKARNAAALTSMVDINKSVAACVANGETPAPTPGVGGAAICPSSVVVTALWPVSAPTSGGLDGWTVARPTAVSAAGVYSGTNVNFTATRTGQATVTCTPTGCTQP